MNGASKDALENGTHYKSETEDKVMLSETTFTTADDEAALIPSECSGVVRESVSVHII